jgi:hypothetical protein
MSSGNLPPFPEMGLPASSFVPMNNMAYAPAQPAGDLQFYNPGPSAFQIPPSGEQSGNNAGFSSRMGPMSAQQPSGSLDNEDEQTLWQELEIDPPAILRKVVAVTFPLKSMTPEQEEDSDMAGPFFITCFLGLLLLLQGKLHFGILIGYGFLGSFMLSTLINVMSPDGITLDRTISILGYAMLPLCFVGFLSLIGVVTGLFGTVVSIGSILWCTLNATRCIERLGMREQRYLIAYPVALMYACFALITVF